MADKNVKENPESADPALEEVQTIPETAGDPDGAPTAPEQSGDDEKEPPVNPGENGGGQTDDKENTGGDTEPGEVAAGVADEAPGESVIPDEPAEKTDWRNRIAGDVFEKNAQYGTLYFTSDLVPFFVESDALRHAGTLRDGTVVTVNRGAVWH